MDSKKTRPRIVLGAKELEPGSSDITFDLVKTFKRTKKRINITQIPKYPQDNGL